jgi:hypothetical protein
MKIERCRSCNAKIVWLPATSGKMMPVDAKTCKPGDAYFHSTKHVSHFRTCPNADGFGELTSARRASPRHEQVGRSLARQRL